MPALALRALAVILGARLLVLAVEAVPASSNAFVAHYAAARLVTEGADAERFYDEEWFGAQVRRFEPGVADSFWANPPTMGLLMLPLARADYRTARAVWILGSLLLLAATVAYLVRELTLPGAWAAGFVCVAVVAGPVAENLRHGQVYGLALALLTLSWWGWREGRDGWLGGPLGVLLATKATTAAVWLLLLVRGRWRGLAWGGGVVLAFVAGSLPFLGTAAWARWAAEAAALPSDPLLAVTAFQSVPGFWSHLLGAGDSRVGAPVFPVPALAAVATSVTVLGLLATSVLAARRAPGSDASFAAFVVLALAVSPVSSEAHYTVALLPVALLGAGLRLRGAPTLPSAVLLLGTALLAVDVPYRSPRLAHGLRALAAYPRLYGGLLLWGLAVTWALRGPQPEGGAAGAAVTAPGGPPAASGPA